MSDSYYEAYIRYAQMLVQNGIMPQNHAEQYLNAYNYASIMAAAQSSNSFAPMMHTPMMQMQMSAPTVLPLMPAIATSAIVAPAPTTPAFVAPAIVASASTAIVAPASTAPKVTTSSEQPASVATSTSRKIPRDPRTPPDERKRIPVTESPSIEITFDKIPSKKLRVTSFRELFDQYFGDSGNYAPFRPMKEGEIENIYLEEMVTNLVNRCFLIEKAHPIERYTNNSYTKLLPEKITKFAIERRFSMDNPKLRYWMPYVLDYFTSSNIHGKWLMMREINKFSRFVKFTRALQIYYKEGDPLYYNSNDFKKNNLESFIDELEHHH